MKHIFITGEMRSGTTFLCNFLNSQENINAFSDLYTTIFMEAHAMGIQSIDQVLTERHRNVLHSNLAQSFRLNGLDPEKIKRFHYNSWWEFYERGLETLIDNSSIKYVGSKRTREIGYIRQLIDKGVRIIYVYRDPRDVMISGYNRFGSFDLNTFINQWKDSIEFFLSLGSHKNLHLIKFENLILQSKDELNRLSEFLDISISTDVGSVELKFGKKNKFINNSSFSDVNKLFDSNAVGRWKGSDLNKHIILTEVILKNLMYELGYEQSNLKNSNTKNWVSGYNSYSRKKYIKSFLKNIL